MQAAQYMPPMDSQYDVWKDAVTSNKASIKNPLISLPFLCWHICDSSIRLLPKRMLTQVVVPALPALLPGPPVDAIHGDHVLLHHCPVFRPVRRHELSHGVVVMLCPRPPASCRQSSRKKAGWERGGLGAHVVHTLVARALTVGP